MKTAVLSLSKPVVAAIFLAMVFALVPLAAFGQGGGAPADVGTPVVPPSTTGPIADIGEGIDLFRQVLSWFAIIFWIAAALFVFYAAFLYLTAAGNEEQVKKASSQLLYAVIAIAVGLMAYGLPAFVNTFLGSGQTTTP